MIVLVWLHRAFCRSKSRFRLIARYARNPTFIIPHCNLNLTCVLLLQILTRILIRFTITLNEFPSPKLWNISIFNEIVRIKIIVLFNLKIAEYTWYIKYLIVRLLIIDITIYPLPKSPSFNPEFLLLMPFLCFVTL